MAALAGRARAAQVERVAAAEDDGAGLVEARRVREADMQPEARLLAGRRLEPAVNAVAVDRGHERAARRGHRSVEDAGSR
jgi:hypothetical protein